jgi:hypothetical protein
MGFRRGLSLAALGLCTMLLTVTPTHATTLTYSGTFTSDDQVQLYSYSLTSDSNAIFATNSYGGGTSNGMTVAPGGFVPVLSLFDSTGTIIASDGADATCSAGMNADPGTGMCDDAYLSENLMAGSYTLAVTEFFNVPVGPNVSDGFLMQGQGNFTGDTCGASGPFYQTDVAPCVQRDGNFSVNISSTPEPSTLWLGAIPLILFGLVRRHHAGSSKQTTPSSSPV